MSEIQCSFATSSSSTADMITARLKKPVGFKGSPLFADDRNVNPEADRTCSIRPESGDPDNIGYILKITDFSRCGVLKRNVNDKILNINCNLCQWNLHKKITNWYNFTRALFTYAFGSHNFPALWCNPTKNWL